MSATDTARGAWIADLVAQHARDVAAGLHDDQCERVPSRAYCLCHCSKRNREANGYTSPPGDLEWSVPSCPRCHQDVYHDGDGWICDECHAVWRNDGSHAEFTDDHGTLTPPAAAGA